MTGGKILTDEVIAEILAIRDTGATNMFDVRNVDRIAKKFGFTELQKVLKSNKGEYVAFIMFGQVA